MEKSDYIRMTNASDVFSCTWNQDSQKLVLRWDMALDLKCTPIIRLSAIQMAGLYVDEYIFVPLTCNLIDSTTLNPLRELDRIAIAPESPLVSHSSTGEQILTEPKQTNQFRGPLVQHRDYWQYNFYSSAQRSLCAKRVLGLARSEYHNCVRECLNTVWQNMQNASKV